MLKYVFLFSLLFNMSISIGQHGDCFYAIETCHLDSFLTSPSGFGTVDELQGNSISNPSTNPNASPGNYGCLQFGEINSNWMKVTIDTSGTFEWYLSMTNGCVDWIMWRYDSTSCDSILNNALPPIACNKNTQCTGISGMVDSTNLPSGGFGTEFENPIQANAGDEFVILMSNYSNTLNYLHFNNIGTAKITSCPITTDISTIYQNDISVHPTLFEDRIEISNFPQGGIVSIYDINGKRVLRSAEKSINSVQLMPGVYVITIENQHLFYSTRLVKN